MARPFQFSEPAAYNDDKDDNNAQTLAVTPHVQERCAWGAPDIALPLSMGRIQTRHEAMGSRRR